MKLTLIRGENGLTCNIGELRVNGQFFCYTLEDPVREVAGVPVENWKIKGETAIPFGTYRVNITPSQRFGRDLPLLMYVPGFDGVRIHPGNTDVDTEGCILVGDEIGADGESILHSRDAFNRIFPLIQAAGDVTIEISQEAT